MKVRCLQTQWVGDVLLMMRDGQPVAEPVSMDAGVIDLAQCVVVEATFPERRMLEQCGLAGIVSVKRDDEWTTPL